MTYRPIADYLLHRPPMLLLDRVLEARQTHIVCETTLKTDSPFCDGATVPGWVGIEYMAQSIGVLSGWRALQKQLPLRVGFLASVRHYRSHVPQFRVGDVLRITADEEVSTSSGLIAMNCTVRSASGALLAEASLLVFQPDDLDAYLQQTPPAHENGCK
ncbi:MAG: hypothetical protein LBU76_05150 [Azoarcus sp.]|jgi:predicted hotdog family 3-hydroxylacyl-ACP dehydratase|nr:hypothetical protein [Azoarcus sp.]